MPDPLDVRRTLPATLGRNADRRCAATTSTEVRGRCPKGMCNAQREGESGYMAGLRLLFRLLNRTLNYS